MTEIQILEQLKRKYRAGMVSALVGAGFTKNIYDKAPSWWDLLRDLVEEAYAPELDKLYQQYVHCRFGVDIESFEACKKGFVDSIIEREGYLNVVSRFIEFKGCREAIDYYIETHNPYFYKIADGKYGVLGDTETVLTKKDLTVHQRFLQGNWQYVFTTNFDNALEFTSEQFDMDYVTICSDYEMSRKQMAHPIVKIHGSLVPFDKTLEYPFVFDGDHAGRYIISREDFESYFKKHEAFSYLLRVALLTGSYCLLGFSGDDPNFKSWLGWVKDILDKESFPQESSVSTEDGEVQLVKDGEQDIKVFLLLTDDKPLSEPQKLYYRNHHIGVIHLDTQEIRTRLKISSNSPISHKIDHFLKYIVGTWIDASPEMDTSSTERFSSAKAWRKVYDRICSKEPVEVALSELKERLTEDRFVKGSSIQEYVLDKLLYIRKAELSDAEKELLLLAMPEAGVPTFSIPQEIKTQVDSSQSWQEMVAHEASLIATDEMIEDDSDFAMRENILRYLYRFDFVDAKQLYETWHPTDRYETVKASLCYFFDRTDSMKQLDSYIMNASSDAERYTASFFYNCIESGFIATYPLSSYRNKGLVGLNDVLLSIIDELKEKKEELNTYGTETIHIWMDDTNPDAPSINRAYRLLTLISNEGFNLCYGISNIIKAVDWYQVFRRMYTLFPHACLYYSAQYNNKKVLHRIGQDFAFETSLKDILPKLIRQIFKALSCEQTPMNMISGILQIGSQLFFGMKEGLWYDDFLEYLSGTYTQEEGRFIYSTDAKSFVKSALVCLHDKEHISKTVTILLKLFDKMPDDVNTMMIYHIRLNKLGTLSDEQTELIEKIAAGDNLKNTATLLSVLDGSGLLSKEIKDIYVKSRLAMIEEVNKSDRFTLFNLCCLADGMNEEVIKLKDVILNRNIWDCGVMSGGFHEAHPFYLMHLPKSYSWSVEEIAKISENLKSNLSLLTHDILAKPFFMSSQKSLLQEMKHYAAVYPVDTATSQEIEEKLVIAQQYDSLENGLYSDNPEAVEDATTELNQQFRDGKFEENRHLFDILLSKVTMRNTPGLSECMVTISVAVHFCADDIQKCPELLDALYRLLLQYKDKDLRELDVQVINVAHSLLEIATFLSRCGRDDENIRYWINNDNLTRLNYLEY